MPPFASQVVFSVEAGGQQTIPPESHGVLKSLLLPFNARESADWVHVLCVSCAAKVPNCPQGVLVSHINQEVLVKYRNYSDYQVRHVACARHSEKRSVQ